MRAIRKLMHIDGPDQVTMAGKTAGAADPISVLGLMTMPASGTLATCSSFGASEARDMSLFGFVGEIIDVFAILPQGHAAVLMAATITGTHTMRIADEERSDLVGDTKVDDLPGGLMTLITNATFVSFAYLVLDSLQFHPATGILLTSALLFRQLSHLLIAVAFERTDTTPCNDQGLLCIRSNSSEMDFSQVDSSLFLSWSMFSLWYLNAHMQLKASVPDQRTGSTFSRKIERQNQRGTPSPHWQDDPSFLFADGLSRPHHGIEPLGFVGIAHLWSGWLELARGVNVSKEGMHDHLDGLTMQGKSTFGGFLQFIASRPFRLLKTSLFMHLHAAIPDLCRLLLRGLQSDKLASRQVFKSIDAHGFHGMMIA
jgi:hypothetical protein